MNTYLYDGSFDGLLTAFFYAYRDADIYTITRWQNYQPDLLSHPRRISTQADKAGTSLSFHSAKAVPKHITQPLSAVSQRAAGLRLAGDCAICGSATRREPASIVPSIIPLFGR